MKLAFIVTFFSMSLISCQKGENSRVLEEAPKVPYVEKRQIPDLTHAELASAGNGYTIRGAFGEISAKASMTNNYSMDGVFYAK